MLQKLIVTPFQTYFKHAVYGLRFLLKSEGLSYSFLHLPEIKKASKLPVVHSKQEVWAMFKTCTLLKHKVLIGLLYGCGLRCMEVRSVKLQDVSLCPECQKGKLELVATYRKGKLVETF